MSSIAAVAVVSCFVAKFCNISEGEIESELRTHLYCYSPLSRISWRRSKSKCTPVGANNKQKVNGGKSATKLEKIRVEVEAALKRKGEKGRAVVLKKGFLGGFDSDEDSFSSSCDASFSDEGSDDTDCSPEPAHPRTIDISMRSEKTDMSLLRHAAMNNDYPALLCGLRSNKYDPNDVDPIHGQSPLHLAADGGYLDCVTLLLSSGANPNCADNDGMSVLQAAVLAGNVTVARVLLENGANPDHYDMDGDSPRMLATENVDCDHDWKEMRDLFMKEFPLVRRRKSWDEVNRGIVRRDSCCSVLSAIDEDEETT